LAAATSFIAEVIFFVLFTDAMRSRMALAFPSMTIVLFLFLWAFSSPKTLFNAGAAGDTSVLGVGAKALAVERAAARVATQRNFMVVVFSWGV